ncbi:hypothetical protein GCM10020221_35180 [Streptomyces thioluteus]|uniref:Peptidase n=1 Tax=Streptomyces thioluteus TaxID=66431 RepID=A0ABP6JMU3_STRTU
MAASDSSLAERLGRAAGGARAHEGVEALRPRPALSRDGLVRCALLPPRSGNWTGMSAAAPTGSRRSSRETGFPTVEVWETGTDGDGGEGNGAPAVFAEWPSGDDDAPTVLVYGHHDVQPAAREDGLAHDPFEPVLKDGRLYGRGAADDKGQVFFHTLGVRAHLAATGRTAPAVNLKLIVEGEEEFGSPNFPALIRDRADRLACDSVIVSDTGMWSEDTPTVCTGMRGLVECQIDLYGPDQDNPLRLLRRGRAQPGHRGRPAGRRPARTRTAAWRSPASTDGVVSLTTVSASSSPSCPSTRSAGGAPRTRTPRWAMGRLHHPGDASWARPTAEVNGIGGGYQGPAAKTIVRTRPG